MYSMILSFSAIWAGQPHSPGYFVYRVFSMILSGGACPAVEGVLYDTVRGCLPCFLGWSVSPSWTSCVQNVLNDTVRSCLPCYLGLSASPSWTSYVQNVRNDTVRSCLSCYLGWSAWPSWTSVYTFTLWYCQEVPALLSGLVSLTLLDILCTECILWYCQEVPALLSGLVSLTLLDLRTNPKLKKIPPDLARYMIFFDLIRNFISGKK